jgi:hydroxypyruvate isomerase
LLVTRTALTFVEAGHYAGRRETVPGGEIRMIKMDVCFETMFTDLPYEQRILRIGKLGFKGIEFWHPEGTWDGTAINAGFPKDAAVMKQACAEAGLEVRGFVLNAWDGSYGGSPSRAEDRGRFIEQVHRTIDFAGRLGCPQAIVMTGLVQPGQSRTCMRGNIEKAFGEALAVAEKARFTLLVEPLNTLVDHAGFYLDSVAEAAELVRLYGSPRMRLLYDVYHMQIMGGNVVDTIRRNIDILGHIHVAGVPGRAEPDECELDFGFILRKADELGYRGWCGLEYFPRLPCEESLGRQLALAG